MSKSPASIVKPKGATHFVREWRKHRKMTQEQLAEAISATSGSISQLENGIINYTQPTLEALAAALRCKPADLLSGPPEPYSGTEARLRAAMIAFGVDREELGKAVSAVKLFLADSDEQSESDLHQDQSEPANRRRAKEPSR